MGCAIIIGCCCIIGCAIIGGAGMPPGAPKTRVCMGGGTKAATCAAKTGIGGAGYENVCANCSKGMPVHSLWPAGMPKRMWRPHSLSAPWLNSLGSSLHEMAYAARRVETGSEFSKLCTSALYSPSLDTVKSGTSGAKALDAVKLSLDDFQKPPCTLSYLMIMGVLKTLSWYWKAWVLQSWW